MTVIRFTGRVELNGQTLRCPGRGPADVPRHLTFIPTGATVSVTCGQKHRGPTGGHRSGCFWAVEGFTPAALQGLAQAKPGRVRVTLPGGRVLEGRVTAVDTSAGKAGSAAAAHAAKTKGKGKDGKTAPAPHAARNQSGGGTAKAAFMAVAAIAGAVGQTAQAVGATAGAVGKGFDVAKEGAGIVRDGIKAADNAGARSFARHNTKTEDS
jgi:hypothetical protein